MQMGIRLTDKHIEIMERRVAKINESLADFPEIEEVTPGKVAKQVLIKYLESLTEDDLK